MIANFFLSLSISFLRDFGIYLVFLGIFIEAAPFVGVLIPGTFILFIAGFFARIGLFDLWIVFIAAICGAVLGDLAGYLFGRYYGLGFIHKYGKYFLIRKEYLEKSCEIVHNHTGKSLIFGRFNPLTRCAAPFILGANKVRFGKFMFFNIVGGSLWSFILVTVGYLLGQNYMIAEKFERYILYAFLIVIASFYIIYFAKLMVRKINNRICIANGTSNKK